LHHQSTARATGKLVPDANNMNVKAYPAPALALAHSIGKTRRLSARSGAFV
jgi:hypothetical protein